LLECLQAARLRRPLNEPRRSTRTSAQGLSGAPHGIIGNATHQMRSQTQVAASRRTKIAHGRMPGTGETKSAHVLCKEGNQMKQPNDVFNDLQSRVSELLKNSPARDVERNVRAMLSQGFSKLELVTREEFDAQTQVLVRTRQRLEELERRVAELEQKLPVTGQSS
jgi:ubiquinone biosynthesis accessory factor UbiK